MASKFQVKVDKDIANKKLIVTREFDAESEMVWRAWTEKELLDQWWSPEPYRMETKHHNFREGDYWLYAMVSPENERHWCRADFLKINSGKWFEWHDAFCDEKGNINKQFPRTHWHIEFLSAGSSTTVKCTLSYETEADLKKILELGMEQGFTMTLNALDRYLKEGFKIRKENTRPYQTPRVTTYLNFPGNTEEAFNFYKSVFKTEFIGKGLQRFGDIKPESGHPPVPDNIKKMILHVELPILGGHVLMATDAPKEMGFTLSTGNNMHICLEPSTREETKRLFDELSEGGKITMPMADMFFGAYFGECTDKYGINWMFNCFEKK